MIHLTEDVKTPVMDNQSGAPAPTTEPSTAPSSEPSQTSVTTPGTQGPATTTVEPTEKTVPLSALKKERQKWQQRLRQAQSTTDNMPTYDPNDPDSKDAYIQDLQGQVAVSKLKDEVRSLVKDYPDLPKSYRQAILRNPVGFANPGERNVQNAVFQIQDYIESVMEEMDQKSNGVTANVEPPKKSVVVAGGNTPTTGQPGTTPADILAIMKKDIFTWTDAEAKKVETYRESLA